MKKRRFESKNIRNNDKKIRNNYELYELSKSLFEIYIWKNKKSKDKLVEREKRIKNYHYHICEQKKKIMNLK